ncbi:MAG: ABC transporter substrate-binding protein [Thermodesulfobacteriota bacterium]
MKGKIIFLSLAITASVLLWGFFGSRVIHAADTTGVTDNSIKIGHIFAYTGPVVDSTMHYNNAMEAYFKDLNERGGVNGRKINFLKEDDGYAIPRCIAAFKKLVFKDNIFAGLTMGGTGQTFAMFQMIEKSKLPCIIVSKAETMTTPLKRYIFTGGPSYEDMARALVDYIVKDTGAKDPKIGIVYPDNAYGKWVTEAAAAQIKLHGLELARKEVLNFGAIDASSQVLNLQRAGATHVILVQIAAGAIAFLKDAVKYNYKPQLFGHYYACAETTLQAAGDLAEGLLGVHAYVSWFDNAPGMIKARKITGRYYPGYDATDRIFTDGWVISMMVEDALKRAGRNLSRESFMSALESTRNLDLGGIGAPLSLSPTNHKPAEACRIFRADVKKKVMVPVSGWIKASKK